MKISLILGLLCITAFARAEEIPVVKPELAGMSAERLARVAAMNDRYTGAGRIAGVLTTVVRDGSIVHRSASGVKGVEDPRPLAFDDLFRIYSMTKPITAVAAMQLYEQGKFQLTDPVSKFVPELKELQVLTDGELVPAEKEMTMQQLLSHTAGLSYGFDPEDPVDKLYREAGLWAATDLDDFIARLAALPLKYEPGTRWHYSVAVDVTGLVVQRLSGQRFDVYLRENLFKPLDMKDTFFQVPEEKRHRFLPNHNLDQETGKAVPAQLPPEGCHATCNYDEVTLYSGGGGLVSTLRDYVRFAEAMRNGGELHGVRILGPKTVAYMRTNHVPGSISGGGSGEDPMPADTALRGVGFGLGFGIVTDTAETGVMGSNGQYYWGGAAGTIFWIDPVEDIVVVSMMQLMGGWSFYRPDLRVATYQAIIESKQ